MYMYNIYINIHAVRANFLIMISASISASED